MNRLRVALSRTLCVPTLGILLGLLVGCQPRVEISPGVQGTLEGGAVFKAQSWQGTRNVNGQEQGPASDLAMPSSGSSTAVPTTGLLSDPIAWTALLHHSVLEEEVLLADGEMSFSIKPVELPSTVSAQLPQDQQTRLDQALEALSLGEEDEGGRLLQDLAQKIGGKHQERLRAWLYVARYQRVDSQTQTLGKEELALIERGFPKDSPDFFWTLADLVSRSIERGHLETARSLLSRLNDFETTLPLPQGLSRAWLYYLQGAYEFESKQFDASYQSLRSALKQAELVGDRGLLRSRIWIKLGAVYLTWSNLERADEYFHKALAFVEPTGVRGELLGFALSGLARSQMRRGKNREVRAQVEDALDIGRQVGGLFEAKMRINYCNILSHAGELYAARKQIDRATEIIQTISPDSHWEALALTIRSSLGSTSWELKQALADAERSWAIRRKLAPESLATSSSLIHLGELSLKAGDLDRADRYFSQALGLDSRITSRRRMRAVINLGRLAQAQGNYEQARNYHQEALDYYSANPPGRRELGSTFRHLGLALAGQEKWDEAEALFEQAIQETSNLKLDEARVVSMVALAGIYASRGELDRAQKLCMRSIDDLEAEAGVAATPLARGGFLEQHDTSYRDCIDYHMRDGNLETAFSLVERYRARQFLDSLAERDLLFTASLPKELATRKAEVSKRLDGLLREMNWAVTRGNLEPVQVHRLEQALADADRERIAIHEEVRLLLPGIEELESPTPLSFQQAAAALAPGTLLASYSVGKDYSLVFTLDTHERLSVHRLEVSRQQLRDRVEQMRGLIRQSRPDLSIGEMESQRLLMLSKELFALLVQPFSEQLERADRLLILPDGPLALLPFSALHDEDRYLVEQLPLSYSPSISVYQKLRRSTAPDHPLELLALGAPDYASAIGDLPLSELPFSRREVEDIATLFPASRRRALLGSEASEANFKTNAVKAKVIHLSAHGFVDDRYPLSSGLALSPVSTTVDGGASEDGALLAREVFEEVRLTSDLVVLSACETGLGALASGEGLIGLTRAFQYAGARSVVASQWRISDEVTARLMQAFYRHLVDERPLDEALQLAQVETLRNQSTESQTSADTSSPYYWAAFQLTGRPERLTQETRSAHDTSPPPVPQTADLLRSATPAGTSRSQASYEE